MVEPKMNRPVKFQSGILKGKEHRKRERDLDVKWRTTVRWMLNFKV
jgi:hypothetical protein